MAYKPSQNTSLNRIRHRYFSMSSYMLKINMAVQQARADRLASQQSPLLGEREDIIMDDSYHHQLSSPGPEAVCRHADRMGYLRKGLRHQRVCRTTQRIVQLVKRVHRLLQRPTLATIKTGEGKNNG